MDDRSGAGPVPRGRAAAAPATVTGVARMLVDVRDRPLSVDECLDAVRDHAAGGVALFVGVVRDDDGGRRVRGLEYSGHPSAPAALRRVAVAVAGAFPVRGLAVVHRVGPLAVGELAVVVAVSCPHRAEAFAACRRLVDDVKEQVPIWKRQVFAGGAAEWVGTP